MINSGIEKNEPLQGIDVNIYNSKKEKLMALFEAGKARGYCDDFGNFILKNVNDILNSRLKNILGKEYHEYKIAGIFGEIISPYNPIVVDRNIKYGQYYFDNIDFKYAVFDILLEKNGQYEFADPSALSELIPKDINIEPVEFMKIEDINSMLDKYIMEEGVIIKTKDSYFKVKREEVLEWERMMGKLPSVMKFSIEHVISELGFSKDDVMINKSYANVETLNKIKSSVWNEINQYSIKKEDLIEYYKGENNLIKSFNSVFDLTILTGITSVLATSGIPKEKLYLEIPNYYYFVKPPLMFNEKRKKFLPANKDYSRIIGSIIGRVYQKHQ